jgi:hypothetical protein
VSVARRKRLASHRLFLKIFASQGFCKYRMEFGTLERALNNVNVERGAFISAKP